MADEDLQDLDMEQLLAPHEPSTFSKVISSPWLQFGLPLAAGVAGGIGRGIGPGVHTGLQAMQGLSGMALGQQRADAANEQRKQRQDLLGQFVKTPEFQQMNPQQRVSAIGDIRAGKGIPEPKLYNLRPGSQLTTGTGDVKASVPAATPAEKYQIVQGADGQYYALDKSDPTAKPIPYSGLQAKPTGAGQESQLNNAISALAAGTTQFGGLPQSIQTGLQPLGVVDQKSAKAYIGAKPEVIASAQAQARQPFQINLQQTGQDIKDAAQANKRIKPGELVLDSAGKAIHPKTYGEADKAGAQVYGVQDSNTWKANTTLLTHAQLTRQAVEKALPRLVAGNPNRMQAFLNMKLDEFQNQPEVVNLFKGLGPMTAIAAAGSLGGGGTRGGVRLAVMLAPAGVQEGDSVGVMLGKLHNWIDVAQGKVDAVGLPTKPFEDERAAIEKMTQSLSPKQVQVGGKTLHYVP